MALVYRHSKGQKQFKNLMSQDKTVADKSLFTLVGLYLSRSDIEFNELIKSSFEEASLPRFPENSAIHGLIPAGLKFSGKNVVAELLRNFVKSSAIL
jgi:hypothetical protein